MVIAVLETRGRLCGSGEAVLAATARPRVDGAACQPWQAAAIAANTVAANRIAAGEADLRFHFNPANDDRGDFF